jgi:hypothetical protein
MKERNRASSESYSLSVKSKVNRWILEHDNSALFNILYIGLAVVLSVWLGLFWLIAVVGIHALIEFYRQYLIFNEPLLAFNEMLWELKLDFALIFFAFWLAVYLDFIFGIVGLTAGARVAAQAGSRVAQTGTRFAVWQRVIRGFFLSLDDAGMAMRALARKKGNISDIAQENEGHLTEQMQQVRSSWFGRYNKGDWFVILFGATIIILILISPFFTGKSLSDVISIILGELKPF